MAFYSDVVKILKMGEENRVEESVINLNNLSKEEQANFAKIIEKGSKNPNIPFPQKGDYYYYLADNARIERDVWKEDGSYKEDFRAHHGNCFRTQDECEEYMDALHIKRRWANLAKESWVGVEDRGAKGHYFPYYSTENEVFGCGVHVHEFANVNYFSNEMTMYEAINLIGHKKVKKYILNVPEDWD